ncbi:glutamyl-tRNA synthetase [Terfezia boudieri ATCC MYA-4762]|uniref:glutamate--tRNA ligase n=1 Tax=Terfezia boudieri ATCC MYA-4762 TaxID=1051890 RepID=A0A3N4LHC9_9PEZI|nr:glutamyl-tRNA synthetase [Terfezia boudieri ATCC MYA-4762]
MPQFAITIAGKAASSAGQTIYPSVIAASIVQEAVPTQSIAIAVKENEPVLVKAVKSSTIGLQFEGEDIIYGYENVLRKLIESFPKELGVKSELEEYWVNFTLTRLFSGDFKETSAALEELNNHLVLRTYLVGYSLTIADISVWGALRGSNAAYLNIKKGHHVNLARWFRYIEANNRVSKGVDTLREELSAKKKVKSQGSNYEIGLLDTDKGVVTRFPPEPSGYLHIGHAKAAMLNQYFAQQYNGKLIIRFDDTNPTKEKQEFEDSILEDLKLLGVKGDIFSYSSDYFQQLYDYAIKMIELGKAYCDDTEQAKMRDERFNGIASARRDTSVEENLRTFKEEMTNATELGKKYCVRAKISVDSPNKALRDPVIYRCNPEPHHRTGTRWKLYPTYDFTCPIVDSIEGVTHALRTIEYRDRNDQYQWMIKTLGLRKVHIWDFSRLNFIKTLLSKRKLHWFVDQGLVWGWDDPRFPTVRGIRRRGMTIEGLKQFILAQGPSKNVVNLDWTIIWATNKKVIDPISPRHTAVFFEDAVIAKVIGASETPTSGDRPRHAKNKDLGTKKVYFGPTILLDQADAASFKDGEEITLMSWGNAIVSNIATSPTTGKILSLDLTLHLEGDFKKTEKKVTWLEKVKQNLVFVELVDFDYLITKDKLEEEDNIEDFVNKNTEFRIKAIADESVGEMEVGQIMQFERKGYYRLDSKAEGAKPAVFFCIPTGKEK